MEHDRSSDLVRQLGTKEVELTELRELTDKAARLYKAEAERFTVQVRTFKRVDGYVYVHVCVYV
jgi:hypothetical protein